MYVLHKATRHASHHQGMRPTKAAGMKAKGPRLQNQVAEESVCFTLNTITRVIITHPQKKRPLATYYDVKIEPCSEAAELHRDDTD